MSDAVSKTLVCPVCARGGANVVLSAGASLDGSSCKRCGGTVLPTTGSERLLHEELALDRAALVDLAASFGGRRFACPCCDARMRTLMLRGVDVDLCFHCGALWLELGELERLSGNRHRGLAPEKTATTTTLAARPEASLRLDGRDPFAKFAGAVVGSVGVAGLVAFVTGFAAPALVVVAGAAVVGGVALRWRKVVDVFPRARRFLRSRRWMPVLATDEDAERLDARTFVVVRPTFGGVGLCASSYVDSVGRVLAPLDRGRRKRVLARARVHARRLGAAIVVDGRVDKDVDVAAAVPAVGGDIPFSISLQRGPTSFWTFEAAGVRRERVFTLQNAVPARGNEDRHERLALCFCLQRNDEPVLRFHDDGAGHTVVVGKDGDAWGNVRRRGTVGFDWLSFAFAGRALRLHLLLPPFGLERPIVDDAGVRCGVVRLEHGRLNVEVSADASELHRFGCVALAAHAALDAGRLLEAR